MYALAALGYEDCQVEPFFILDETRWAEFVVYLGRGNNHATKEFLTIYAEIQKVKPASSKLAYFTYVDNAPFEKTLYIGPVVSSYTDILLNISESIVLIRDREFNPTVFMGGVVTTYSETILVHANELILIQNRTFPQKLLLKPIISSYMEEYLP